MMKSGFCSDTNSPSVPVAVDDRAGDRRLQFVASSGSGCSRPWPASSSFSTWSPTRLRSSRNDAGKARRHLHQRLLIGLDRARSAAGTRAARAGRPEAARYRPPATCASVSLTPSVVTVRLLLGAVVMVCLRRGRSRAADGAVQIRPRQARRSRGTPATVTAPPRIASSVLVWAGTAALPSGPRSSRGRYGAGQRVVLHQLGIGDPLIGVEDFEHGEAALLVSRFDRRQGAARRRQHRPPQEVDLHQRAGGSVMSLADRRRSG